MDRAPTATQPPRRAPRERRRCERRRRRGGAPDRRRRGSGGARGGVHARAAHPAAELSQPVGRVRRTGAAQGREPAAHRLVQAARRGAQDLAPGGPPGVVAGSAGNHGQSLAYAARAQGIPCEVFMPREAAGGQGRRRARRSAAPSTSAATRSTSAWPPRWSEPRETGAGFVHPFDDPDVILGQATLGLELLEDVPDLETVVVPVGGGGLISGVAGVVKAARPSVRVIGVQVAACAAFPESLRRARRSPSTRGRRSPTGSPIKRPGESPCRWCSGGWTSSWWSARTTSPRRWCGCWSAPSSSSRAAARSASRRCSAVRSARRRTAPP